MQNSLCSKKLLQTSPNVALSSFTFPALPFCHFVQTFDVICIILFSCFFLWIPVVGCPMSQMCACSLVHGKQSLGGQAAWKLGIYLSVDLLVSICITVNFALCTGALRHLLLNYKIEPFSSFCVQDVSLMVQQILTLLSELSGFGHQRNWGKHSVNYFISHPSQLKYQQFAITFNKYLVSIS